MPNFSKRSQDNLSQCHSDLQLLFNYVIQYIDCSVICGHRDEHAQNEAYRKGTSQLMFPNSKHNRFPSYAADVVPYPVKWEDERGFRIFGNAVLAIARLLKEQGKIQSKIEWGGNWHFRDFPHFQIK